jgi:hypothetical protein
MVRTHRLKLVETEPPVIAAPPAEDDLPLMASLGIRFEDGAYRFACILYDNLHDAANFARMVGASRNKNLR